MTNKSKYRNRNSNKRRNRDYAAEYLRRIANPKKQHLSKSARRGHPLD
jgi:hypothetical protein